jgi:transglutaminase-like putative cysteine protease
MKPYFLICLLLSLAANAQKPEYALALIPAELKENANAVVRLNKVEIDITSRNAMTVKTYRVVTVLNELGQNSISASESDNVKSIAATVYNAFGQEIKKLKRKDFREVSVSEGSIISDNKVTYLDYTPTEYPFTIVYESETSDQNTAFIPRWFPIERLFESVEKSTISVSCISGLGLKFKDYNVGNRNIKKEDAPNKVGFTAENLTAIKREQYSPAFTKLAPYVIFGLEKFNLEGVEGEALTWEGFSAWRYHHLLSGTDDLSIETQDKIKSLVANETDPIKKAKIVYKYVQDKTRYVSIQLGIGGWRPMKAKDVDRLGYGDCKALTNYTRSLLNVVGVPSYYAVIYGDREKEDMKSNFVSMQGNHIILAVPQGEKMNWLECTSQTLPFGFLGDFTDDRLALLVQPEGGKLMRTSIYNNIDNSQFLRGNYFLDQTGKVSATVEIKSTGIKYEDKLPLEKKSNADLADFYKEYFSINNLKLEKASMNNDPEKIEFIENVSIEATDYANVANGKIMFAINAFNQYSAVPQRYRTRNNPFEIDRGFYDEDEITITLPDGFSIEAKPENFELSDVFGKYKTEYTMIDAKHMLYKRSLLINEGSFPAGEYEKFRKFIEQIAKNDNAKCVLMKG